METDAELKAALDREFGSSLDMAGVEEDLRFLYDHPCRVAEEALSAASSRGGRDPTPYRLVAGFYRSDRLNAGTMDLAPDASLIAISTALPVGLFRALAAVIERAEVDTLLPQRDSAGRVVVFPRRRRLGGLPGKGGGELRPVLNGLQTAGQLPLGLLLYDLAMRFIVMHEAMHIVLGHTGCVRQALGAGSLMELGRSRRRMLTPEVSQAMEFIADRHAIRGVAHWVRSGRLGDCVDSIPWDESIDREVFLQRALTVALMTLLLLFPSRASVQAAVRDSHPHTYFRMRWLCREMGVDMPSEQAFLQGVLEPMAYWTASFQRNFLTPGRWSRAIQEDQEGPDDAPIPSDRAYSAMTDLARQWQTRLWEAYAPVYLERERTSLATPE